MIPKGGVPNEKFHFAELFWVEAAVEIKVRGLGDTGCRTCR